MHLWEANHAYYCNSSNYYTNDRTHTYDSWGEFFEEWGGADEDYNLVFRWDWKVDIDDYERPTARGTTGGGTLQICYMLQRKGIYLTCFVKVEGSDEAAVREWLLPKMRHMMSLWAPLCDNLAPPTP